MLSKNQIKFINSLQIKKFRQIHQSFITEGAKSVIELLASDYTVEFVAATTEFQQQYNELLRQSGVEVITATPDELGKAGTFQTNDSCLAVAKTKDNTFLEAKVGEFAIVLDDIRDPGNLGTIIRIADWYGFPKLICSNSTTDFYNPKVIAASKGSFTRVQTYYTELDTYFEKINGRDILGAFLEGQSLYEWKPQTEGGYLIMGNESNGVSPAIEKFVTQKLTIPRFGEAESLNVGIATAILCDGIRRFF